MAAVCLSATWGYATDGTENPLSTSWATMLLSTTHVDTHSFNGASDGTIVIPQTGFYWVSGDVRRGLAEDTFSARLLRNSVEVRILSNQIGDDPPIQADNLTANVTWVGCCVAGDVLELQGAMGASSVDYSYGQITVFRVPSPFMFASTESDTSDGDPITWGEISDFPGWFDSGTPTRFTVTDDGNYFISAGCRGSGHYLLSVSVNGSYLAGHTSMTAQQSSDVALVDVVALTAGDYVEVFVDDGAVTVDVEQLLVFKLPDGCKVVTASDSDGQSVSSIATLNLDTDEIDPDGFHDTSTNNERLTVPSGCAGIYLSWGSFNLHAFVTVSVVLYVNAGGSGGLIANQEAVVSTEGSVPLAQAWDLDVGDYVYMDAANNASAATAGDIRLGMMRLDDFEYVRQTCPLGGSPRSPQIYRRR